MFKVFLKKGVIIWFNHVFFRTLLSTTVIAVRPTVYIQEPGQNNIQSSSFISKGHIDPSPNCIYNVGKFWEAHRTPVFIDYEQQ
jgi:hypothetical protein